MSLLAVGSVAYDSVATPFGRADDVLGGSATYFSLSASYLTTVHVVAVVGDDFKSEHRFLLEDRGIDLSGLQRQEGKTFRWAGQYEYDMNQAHTLETNLNVFATFRPQIPEALRTAEYVFLGNIDPDLQRHVLDQMVAPRLVALDTMNFWIAGKKESLLETLARVDLLLINEAEARQLANVPNLVKAARLIQEMGPQRVIVKRGECGALAFIDEHIFGAPAYPLEVVRDPTGAGDTFAGGVMGYIAASGSFDVDHLRRAVVMGSIMASFTVEDFSLRRLLEISHQDVRRRYDTLQIMSAFAELPPNLMARWNHQ
ncbi:MAG: sugar kinase [Candidatus Schekmanbacteria bacterium]|nr:sugar kinase [Candidatus Schekmanbacteria bacterium]